MEQTNRIMSFKWDNYPDIMAASKCVISEGSMLYRYVLRKTGDNRFVTHMETLMLEGDTWKHHGFAHGHYFDSPHHLDTNESQAIENYRQRCAKL